MLFHRKMDDDDLRPCPEEECLHPVLIGWEELTTHLIKVHADKNYCVHCIRKFSTSNNLKKHTETTRILLVLVMKSKNKK